jgi:hypothetical protein
MITEIEYCEECWIECSLNQFHLHGGLCHECFKLYTNNNEGE